MRTQPHMLQRAIFIAVALSALPTLAQTPCATTDTTHFTVLDQGGYNYQFLPDPPTGWTVLTHEWAFGRPDFNDFSLYPIANVQFPGPGTYLACLRANQQEGLGYPCVSTYCELLIVPVDVVCAGLNAGFSIDPQAGSILFNDLTTGLLPGYNTTAWDFGDGTTSEEASPVHTYYGAGPYQACLTVNSGGCKATACNWIYLGPPNVPCTTLLQPAIGLIQYERTIAVFDQSVTSGMNTTLNWDFGDGTQASGSPLLHTYAYDGEFQVCGNIGLWGPLTPDTCMASACETVYTIVSAGVAGAGSATVPKVYPVPFTDRFNVDLGTVDRNARWVLMDQLGRVCKDGDVPASGSFAVAGEEMAPGVYVLRAFMGNTSHILTVVKGRP